MNQLIWNGEMDMGWEDLKESLSRTATKFSDKALKCAELFCNDATKALVNEGSMYKYLCVVDLIAEDLEDSFYYTVEDLYDDSISSLRIKLWIMLGSALEVSLQVYLSISINTYENSQWQQWANFASEETKTAVFSAINKLVQDNIIQATQGRSLKDAIREEIKDHLRMHPIDRIMLDELIQFFDANNTFDKDDIDEMRYIQQNRNCIHAFMDRRIGNWFDLQYAIRFYIYLLELLLSFFPGYDS